MMEKGNFLQRYHKVKQELMETGLKRTGYNNDKGYYYFQLSDFLPILLQLEEKYGIVDTITFENGQATISLFDATENEVKPIIQCSMPFQKEVMELDTNKMKQLGGAETYCRRYLYFSVFGICVQDITELKTDMEEQKEKDQNISVPPYTDLPFYEQPKEDKQKNVQDETIEEIMKNLTKEKAMHMIMPAGPYKNMALGEIINQAGEGFLPWLIQQGEHGPYGKKIFAAANKLMEK